MGQPNEAEIIRQFKAGENEAFKYLVERYKTPLTFFAENIVQNTAEAEDIVSEALQKLYIDRQKLDTIEHIGRWLYTIVRNDAIDYLKHAKVVAKAGDEMGFLDNQSRTVDPEMERIKAFALNSLLDDLHTAIGELARVQQQVVRLKVFEGKTTAEIAEQLDIEDQTVLNHMTRARTALEKKLRNKLPPGKFTEVFGD
jgi:RNA polymerase sigma-70 factor (family 1)